MRNVDLSFNLTLGQNVPCVKQDFIDEIHFYFHAEMFVGGELYRETVLASGLLRSWGNLVDDQLIVGKAHIIRQ